MRSLRCGLKGSVLTPILRADMGCGRPSLVSCANSSDQSSSISCCMLCRMDIFNRKPTNVDQAKLRALGVVRIHEALLENHLG